MKSVLVTGGLGFMGSNFVRYLCRHSRVGAIRVLDNFGYAANPKALDGIEVEVLRADIRDFEILRSLTRGVDVVVNFAAETHNDNSIERPRDFYDANVNGVISILQAARENGFHLHQISTDEVFGDLPLDSDETFNEDSPFRPSSPYSGSKAAADLAIGAWNRTFGIPASITHSANNYGPGQHLEKYLPKMIDLASRGLPLELYGSGRNVRDWLFVDDHSRAVWMAINYSIGGFHQFSLSTGQLFSNLEIAEQINQLAGLPKENVRFVEDRPGHDLKYSSSAQKAATQLGWFAEGPPLFDWLQDAIAAKRLA